jgi:predicted amidohydrolase
VSNGAHVDIGIDLRGAWISPAWIDLHVHCYPGSNERFDLGTGRKPHA